MTRVLTLNASEAAAWVLSTEMNLKKQFRPEIKFEVKTKCFCRVFIVKEDHAKPTNENMLTF